MKKRMVTSAILATLAIPSLGVAIEMTDYTFTDSKYQEGYLQGGFNSNSGNQDQASYSYNVDGNYKNFYSTLPRVWQLDLDANGQGSRGKNDGDKLQDSGSATAHGTVDNYFNDVDKWLWYGAADLGYQSEAEDIYAKVGAGVGYGRVYNATSLAKTLRIIEELGKRDLINASSVSDKTYLDIAQIVDKQAEYRSKYGAEDYRAYWYKAIEEVMVRDQVLKGELLGAQATINMDRVLIDEKIRARKHGWVVRTGVGLVMQDYSGNTDNDPSFDFQWEYAKPFGYSAQFDNLFTYSTVFASDTNQIFNNAMSYTYELTDMIDWINTWDLTYTIPGDSAEENVLTNVLATGFDYYITNTITTGILVTATHVDDKVDNNNEQVEVATLFNIKYRFL